MIPADIREIADDVVGVAAAPLAGRTVLIAGAHGFLGRYLLAVLRELTLRGVRVRVLAVDNGATAIGGDRPIESWYTFRPADITRPLTVIEPVHFVVHCAGIASPYYYRRAPLETFDVAVAGTRNLLDLARDHGAKLLYFSSSEVYGDPEVVPTPESYPGKAPHRGGRAVYDTGKRAGETLCDLYTSRFGVETVTVRPFNVYGPGMRERDYRVLPTFASRWRAGLPLRIYGDGRQTRTYCYVSDAVRGFVRAWLLGKPGAVYNIGCAAPEVSVADLAREVGAALGEQVPVETAAYPDSYPSDEPRRRCPDLGLAEREIGYLARVELRDGLRRFFRWAEVAYTGL